MGLRDALGLTPRAADVLELRVHGVNNTTAPALLDLRPDDVERVAGDKLGSFWRPKPEAVRAIQQGGRGYVPPGITREAYSWGGMVRTTPDVGHAGAAGVIAAAISRVFYALILPFSIANAVQWTRRLPDADDRRRRPTAGLTRLFGLALTLLFTTTAATVAMDIAAAQCAADPALCRPVQSLLAPLQSWTPAQQLAVFALAPVLAAAGLWLLAGVARLRYDVLPGVGGSQRVATARSAARATGPTALLSHGGFWSNRAGRHLSSAHLAAAVLLTTAFACGHAAMRWHTGCQGLQAFDGCAGSAVREPLFVVFLGVAGLALAGLVTTAVVVALLPTTDPHPEEDDVRHGVPVRPRRWPLRSTRALLIGAIVLFVAAEGLLVFARTPDVGVTRLYGAGMAPLIIVTVALAIAVSAVTWRGRGGRRNTAWHGCAPAVFAVLALALAAGTSAVVTVTIGDWLNGAQGAAVLVRDPAGLTRGLEIPSSYVALGLGVLAAFGAALLALLALIPRRDVSARASAWGAPVTAPTVSIPQATSVLPPSPRTLLDRITAKRASAARLHTVEPIGAWLAICLGAGLTVGVVWAWAAYWGSGRALWNALPGADAASAPWLQTTLNLTMPMLAWVGLALVAMLATGAVRGGTRPLGIVWDVVCYLPATGHPFGPPSYAERAVPEIAGRVYTWLDADPRRRAVIAAHSMGGVLAVSALGVLASSPATRPVLSRVGLLTFGVQLRAFFGRFLPELLGPDVIGSNPSLAPRLFARDPWAADFAEQAGEPKTDAAGSATALRQTQGPAHQQAPELRQATALRHAQGPTVRQAQGPTVRQGPEPAGALEGTLLRGCPVPWVSLWRLTDFLGFPAVSTARENAARGWVNPVDRIAEELDLSGYMVEVGTHGEYYRVPAYERALATLGRLPVNAGPRSRTGNLER